VGVLVELRQLGSAARSCAAEPVCPLSDPEVVRSVEVAHVALQQLLAVVLTLVGQVDRRGLGTVARTAAGRGPRPQD
jgi:hypothetical protein